MSVIMTGLSRHLSATPIEIPAVIVSSTKGLRSIKNKYWWSSLCELSPACLSSLIRQDLTILLTIMKYLKFPEQAALAGEFKALAPVVPFTCPALSSLNYYFLHDHRIFLTSGKYSLITLDQVQYPSILPSNTILPDNVYILNEIDCLLPGFSLTMKISVRTVSYLSYSLTQPSAWHIVGVQKNHQ